MKIFKKIPVWIAYTACFLVIISAFWLTFRLTNRSLIWSFDGIAQHYPILIDFRQMLVNFIQHPQHGFTNWAWNIGLGADQLTSFSYYVVGDLFNYLIILFPKNQVALGYSVLVVLRLYCVGLAFLLYCRNFHFKKFSQLISTLTYTFASYALYAGMHHAFFLLPLILFPLLANGIEQVLQRHAVVPLIIAVTITFLSNFYFAYILGLGCLVYVIVRYFDLRTSKSFRPWKSLLSLTAAVIAGLGMAAVLFVPTIMYAFQSTRITNQFANGYHLYPLSYYLGLPGKIIGMGNSFNFWLIIGISGFSLLAIIYVLSHFRKYRALNWSLILLGIGIVFPQVSAIFNAFAAPSNRWLSLGLLPIGLASAYFAEALRHLTHRDLAILAASGPSLLLVIWLSNGGILKLHRHDLVEYLLFFSLIGILLIANLFNWKRRWLQSSVLTLVIVNLISLGIGFYSPNSSSYSKTMYLQNQAQQAVSNYYDQADHYVTPRLNHERTTIGPRYHYQPDQRKNSLNTDYFNAESNIPMVLGTHDIASYLTVENGYVGALEQQVQNNQFTPNNPIAQNDYRTSLENLMGVKYLFLDSTKEEKNLPAGFKIVRNRAHQPRLFPSPNQLVNPVNPNGTIIAKNNEALPLAYTQTHVLTNQQFHRLSPLEREQSLIAAANLPSAISGIKPLHYHSNLRSFAYQTQLDQTNLLTKPEQLDQLPASTRSNRSQPNATYATAQQIKAILKENTDIANQSVQKNRTGLHQLTSDALGNQNQYELTIKNPEQTRNHELYLKLEGITITPLDAAQTAANKANRAVLANRALVPLNQLTAIRNNLTSYDNGSFVITASAHGMSNAVTQLGKDELSNYLPKHQALLNLGYSAKSRKTITIKFDGPAAINIKKARLIAVPFKQNYHRQIKRLQQARLHQLRLQKNTVTGISHEPQKAVLTTSIPYSSGWQLSIDGHPTNTKVVNQAFVGGVVPAGNHRIRLTYHTPGLLVGFIITLITSLCLAGSWLWYLIVIRKSSQK